MRKIILICAAGLALGILYGVMRNDIQQNYKKYYPDMTETPSPTHIIGPTLEEAGLIPLKSMSPDYMVYVKIRGEKTCFMIVPNGKGEIREACLIQ